MLGPSASSFPSRRLQAIFKCLLYSALDLLPYRCTLSPPPVISYSASSMRSSNRPRKLPPDHAWLSLNLIFPSILRFLAFPCTLLSGRVCDRDIDVLFLPTAAWRNGNASDYDLVIRRLQVRPLRWSIACFWDFFWRSPAHPRAVRRKCCSRPTYMLLPSDVYVAAVRLTHYYNTSRSLDPTSTTPSSCAMALRPP